MKYTTVIKFIIALAACFSASAIGALFMSGDSLPGWYAQLNKPPITPPNWVFGPAWTILYIMMAASVFIIWNKGLSRPGVKPAICIFLLQLTLNAAWTPVFFGYHQVFAALVIIILLFFAILATILAFWKISKSAAILLIPYLLWTGFATVLNALIWNLNK